MFGFLKLLPVLILVAGGAWFYHYTTINAKQDQIDDLGYKLQVEQKKAAALEVAQAENLNTIQSLSQKAQAQNVAISELSAKSNAVAAERDAYLSIFKRHNLTKLARAKPGLIEPRANKSTAEVFRSVEQASKEVQNADNTDTSDTDSNSTTK